MSTLSLFLAGALFAGFVASCNDDDIIDNGPGGNDQGQVDPNEDPDEPVKPDEKPMPQVSLQEVGSTETSLTFTLIPKDATSVSYVLLEADENITAEQIFDLPNNVPADATKQRDYTFNNLKGYTNYTIAAAASNEQGFSEVAKITMQTVMPAPSLTLALGNVTSNSASFTLTSDKASAVSYMCVKENEADPDAQGILANGVKAEVNVAQTLTVNELEESASYRIVAAAADLSGQGYTDVQSISFTTLAKEAEETAPQIGDFYYSDGTWSTELNPDKTPIGLVFYIGCATEYKDYASAYRLKDGTTRMENIHGYVVALNDATSLNGEIQNVWWSFFDPNDGLTGASVEITDFAGYTNTRSIVKTAHTLFGKLTGDEDNYPACYYATEVYEKACPAPATSSGWFFPSAYQFKYMFDNVYFKKDGFVLNSLESGFEALGDKATPLYNDDAEYWTSTEKIDSYGTATWAYYFSFDSRSFKPGFIADYRKNAGMRVRSVLVF